MVGRTIISPLGVGVVLSWEPLSSSLCDALIEVGGRSLWVASHTLKAADGQPLPSRRKAHEEATARTRESLTKIRERLISDWHKPWPGFNHGKAIIGKAIDGALEDLDDPHSLL